jgi:ribulose 1,5-bisphosphate synthetase/thiazole synthase
MIVALIAVLVQGITLNNQDAVTNMLDCYDYIIVGGGISGLVVANRLTEDPEGTRDYTTNQLNILTLS